VTQPWRCGSYFQKCWCASMIIELVSAGCRKI